MKPHEQTWEVHPLDFRAVADAKTGLVVADLRVPLGEAREVSALMAAAPEMARALLSFLPNSGHARHCQGGKPPPLVGACLDECASARSALRKAGVLP